MSKFDNLFYSLIQEEVPISKQDRVKALKDLGNRKMKYISVWEGRDGNAPEDVMLFQTKGPWNQETYNSIKDNNPNLPLAVDFDDLYIEKQHGVWTMYGAQDGVGIFVVDEGFDVYKCKEQYDRMTWRSGHEPVQEDISKEDRIKALKQLGSRKQSYANGVEFLTKVLVVKEIGLADFNLVPGVEFVVIPPRYEEDIKNLIWFKITKDPHDMDDNNNLLGEESNIFTDEFDEYITDGSLKIL